MDDSEKIKITPEHQRAMKKYLDWFHDARRKGVPQNALLQYYEDDYEDYAYKVDVGGKTYAYPVFTKSEWIGLQGRLDNFVANRSSAKRQNHNPEAIRRIAREMYMRHNKPTDKEVEFPISSVLWNGSSVCISGWGQNNHSVSFDVEKSDFFSYVSTGESMLRELYDELWEQNVSGVEDQDGIQQAIRNLSQRDRIAPSFSKFTRWTNHYHKAGSVCLLVLNRPDEGHDLFFTKRSPYVLQEPGLHSVTPGGELQADRIHDTSLNDLVIQELAEEVFSVPDEISGPVVPDDALDPEIVKQRLANAVDDDQIHIRRTGFAFDMLAVKPIVAGMVYISDPEVGEFIRESLTTNWEADKFKRIQLPRKNVPKEMHPNFASTSGAVAFYEGIRALERQFGVNPGMEVDWKI